MSDGDDSDRPQMAGDGADGSEALTGGDITKYEAFVARISYLSQHPPDLKFASMQVCCAMASPSVRGMERVAGALEAYSKADWSGDRTTRRSVSARVIMRGGHCLKVWTKKQVVSLSTAESELYAAVKTAHGLNVHLDASATMCLVNRIGLGKANYVDMQNLWIQETSSSKKIRHEEKLARTFTATCRRKLRHGAPGVGYRIERDTDWEVKTHDGIDSVNSRSQSVSRNVRHVPEGSVTSGNTGTAHGSCDFLFQLQVTLW